MGNRPGWLLLALLIFVPRPVRALEVSPGVTYTLYPVTMGDNQPNRVHVVAIDRSRAEYKWKVGWSQKKRRYTAREGTSVIASRYHVPGTHEVLAAVNGSYFDGVNLPRIIGIGQTGGEMLDVPAFNSSYQYQTVMVGPSRMPTVTGNFTAPAGVITFADGATTPLNSYNWNGGSLVPINGTSAFSPHFDAVTPSFGTLNLSVEIVLTGVSYPMRSEKEVSGVISQIITSWPGGTPGNTPIPAGGMVLCGYNTGSTILAHAQVGQRVRVKAVTGSPEYNNADNSLTGIGWVVHDGVAYASSWTGLDSGAAYGSRNPRTVLAWNDSTWYMVVCDGRQPGTSVGMTFAEMAAFLTGTLNVQEAVNFDGGGSSTLVVGGTIQNTPSDGSQRPVANAMLLVREDTTSSFPFADAFAATGRLGAWDDKFLYADVVPFAPVSPGGDGHVIRVGSPGSGVNTMRRGDFGDGDYSVQADLYCAYRPDVAADGYERYALFARDSGTGALGLATYGGGNCYAMTYDTDTGRLSAGKYVNGALTDLLSAPAHLADSGWHRFRIDAYGPSIRFWLDDAILTSVIDTTFSQGHYGIGHHSFFTTPANIQGTRADNFVAFIDPLERLPDMDGDDDIDQTDFGLFQICLNGSLPVTEPACTRAHLDDDLDVDAQDMLVFISCMRGPDQPLDPGCLE